MSAADSSVRRPPGPAEPIELRADADTLTDLTGLRDRYGNIAYLTTPRGRQDRKSVV